MNRHVFAPAHLTIDESAPEQYYYTPEAIYPDEEPPIPMPYDAWRD